MKNLSFLLTLLLGVWGCDNFPKDPENTLAQVKNGTLLVGYSENPPWVIETDSTPIGIEADLVKAFAKKLNANIKWRNDTEQDIFEDLEKKKIHLVIAGIINDNPWKKKVAFTRPFVKRGKEQHVMAAIKGENAFIVQLEKFLHEQEGKIKERVQP